jgi:microcystin-dependent protein
MAFSTQRVTSDGTLSSLALSIDYFDRDEISVFFDDVIDALPWAWVGLTEKTISFSPDVPNGVEVLVRRSTPIDEVFHDFDGGAAFVAKTVDENFKQVLHIAQEAVEGGTTGDFFNNLNMHGYKITNLANPVDPGDAVNLSRFTLQENLVITYRNQTIVYRDQAEAFAIAAAASASSVDTATLLAAAASASSVDTATLLARANHTGTQTASTISDLGDVAVLRTGNQSKSGVLTFSDSPIVPTPTTDFQASTKGYADTLATPAGAVMFFAMSTAPAGWLKANGAIISRATYAALFAAIGTTFGVGDGSTTFRLPDLRGEFVRGFDDGKGTDSGRAFGSSQAGQMPSHTHTQEISNSTAGGLNRGAGSNGAFLQYSGTTTAAGGTENSSENRPRNIALLACIKY